jgi:hypothetical protein
VAELGFCPFSLICGPGTPTTTEKPAGDGTVRTGHPSHRQRIRRMPVPAIQDPVIQLL